MAGTPDPNEDDYDPLEGTEGAGLAHVARPGVGDTSSAVPAAAVRALPAPSSLSPATAARTAADEAELNRLETTGSGISQIKNPVARGALRGLNVAGEIGSAFLPELRPVLNATPGTEEHHNQLIKQQTGLLGNDLAAQEKETAAGKTAADTAEANARTNLTQAQADVARNPKMGLTPEETTIHDLMTGDNGKPRVNPKTGQPYSYLDAYTAVSDAKEAAKPVKPEKPDTPEQQFIDDYQQKHKGASVEDAVKAYAQATKVETPAASQNRSDRSYALISGRIDKLRTPIDQLQQRMGRLNDTLAQGTPQADALVAPELLSVMSGGAGSGLRMNEAEISRIVGGRSKWQSLEATLKQWSTDPSKANSITPEQRQQIQALVQTVNQKLMRKQQIIEQADEDLLNSDDPNVHRKVYAEAQKKLNAIDAETGSENSGGGGIEYKTGLIRNGYKFKGGDPTKQENWEKVQTKEAAAP